MRGSPIWQVVCVLGVFTLAGIPIWRLTARAPHPAVVAAPATSGGSVTTSLDLAIGFTPAPSDFSLRYLGATTVLAGQGPTTDFTGKWQVQLPPDGVDLTLQAHWADTTLGHVAAHLVARFPDGHTTEKTVWSDAGQPMVENITLTP